MKCPLCGGPLHVDDARDLVCERGHAMDQDQARVAASSRVTTALWMAIEALGSEAEVLRVMADRDGADGNLLLAEQAEQDAMVLRKLAGAHLPPDHEEVPR